MQELLKNINIKGEEPNILDTKAVVTIGSPGVNNE